MNIVSILDQPLPALDLPNFVAKTVAAAVLDVFAETGYPTKEALLASFSTGAPIPTDAILPDGATPRRVMSRGRRKHLRRTSGARQ